MRKSVEVSPRWFVLFFWKAWVVSSGLCLTIKRMKMRVIKRQRKKERKREWSKTREIKKSSRKFSMKVWPKLSGDLNIYVFPTPNFEVSRKPRDAGCGQVAAGSIVAVVSSISKDNPDKEKWPSCSWSGKCLCWHCTKIDPEASSEKCGIRYSSKKTRKHSGTSRPHRIVNSDTKSDR